MKDSYNSGLKDILFKDFDKNILFFLVFSSTALIFKLFPSIPNYSPLITLSFLINIVTNQKYSHYFFIIFIFSDLISGWHDSAIYVWISIYLIILISKQFAASFYFRLFGVFTSSIIFFILTNIGFWMTGYYGFNLDSLYTTFTMAIPFYKNTLISSLTFFLIFEGIIKFINLKYKIKKSSNY